MLGFGSRNVKEKRKFPRIKENCKIDFTVVDGDQFLKENIEGIANNISGGGISFHTDEKIELGTMLALEVYLPDFPASVSALGKVVRSIPEKDSKRFEIGVEFWWIGWSSDNFQKKMGSFIRDSLHKNPPVKQS